MRRLFAIVPLFCFAPPLSAAETTPAERGYKALTETAFIPASWRPRAYDNAWKHWAGVKRNRPTTTRPSATTTACTPPRTPTTNLPMGLRPGTFLFVKGIAIDCMLCHGGSIFGKSYVGLGNTSLDIQAVFEEMSAADGRSREAAVHVQQRPRHVARPAAFAVYLLGFREPDLKHRKQWTDLDLHDDLCEDTPAWWLLKKKKTMYHTGGDRRPLGAVDDAVHDDPAHARQRRSTRPSRRSRTSTQYLLTHRGAEVPVRDRQRTGREGREAVQGELRRVPRHLRREVDVSEQDRPAEGDRHRPEAVRGHRRRSSARLLQPVVVRARRTRAVRGRLPASPTRATRRRRSTASGRRPRTSTTAACRRCTTC